MPRARPILAGEDDGNTNQTAAEQDSYPVASTSQAPAESKKKGKKRSSVSKKQTERSKDKVCEIGIQLDRD